MYKKEANKTEQIYVLRAKDESCTKIGRSYNPDQRTDTICISERKKYYLVYQSHSMPREEAKALEKLIIEFFKSDCIKGKEWLSTHPLDVIKFIVSKIGVQRKDTIHLEDLATHYVSLSTNNRYNSLTFEHINGVRISKDYYAYVKTIYNGQFITLGFSNIGDAYEFVRKNRHLQEVVPIITELLFNMPYKQWMHENYKQHNSANWLLIELWNK